MATTVKMTNKGREQYHRLANKEAVNAPGYMHWGTGTTAAANTDTALQTPSSEEARVATTNSYVTVNSTNDTSSIQGTLTVATSAKNISEAGVFDASTAGNMFYRATFDAIPLQVGDSLTLTFKHTIGQ
jgi:hypothetical protein